MKKEFFPHEFRKFMTYNRYLDEDKEDGKLVLKEAKIFRPVKKTIIRDFKNPNRAFSIEIFERLGQFVIQIRYGEYDEDRKIIYHAREVFIAIDDKEDILKYKKVFEILFDELYKKFDEYLEKKV